MRILMIGAHQDDVELRCGGLAALLKKNGHEVQFLSVSNGSGGHHKLSRPEIQARRAAESAKVAELLDIRYDVWSDVEDCEIQATLEMRRRMTRYIREAAPDVIITHRTNDYHTDHRNTGMIVQDASYLLIVPHYCPDVPAMKKTPVILYFYDHFQNPPFRPDVAVDIDDVIDDKFKILDMHESQMYEWLPYTKGTLDTVPAGKEERLEWLHEPRIPRDGVGIDEELMMGNLIGKSCEYREAKPAFVHRDALIRSYGEDRGSKVLFAELFSVCEYGAPLDKELIPY